jgi:putative holliday junction resolvase
VSDKSVQFRILGIDFGSKRIGISLSDPLGIIARPVAPLKNDKSLFDNLVRLINDEKVKTVVVGMPLNLKGEHGKKAQEVQEFIDRLKSETKVGIEVWDERFTTTIAKRTMLSMGTKRKEREAREGRLDSMAASVMLQSYLDSGKS